MFDRNSITILFVLALFTYALVGMRRGIRLRHCLALAIGVALDGSLPIHIQAYFLEPITVRGVIGAIAWTLMLILAVATLSVRRDNALLSPGMQRGFWRAGVVFYAIWLLSLITGYATHVAAIDRGIHILAG